MEPEQRQRIIGYFLAETQEYLELLEPGMDDLAGALADEERISELYRAAHSIKGGAAMLALDGIQRVAYRLESTLKFMKTTPVT
ncbi:MAG: histidine kinase, partial [Synechococcales cyanobacterium CRU_2_2]|nr:histidine kinase [Synechococcales cyanobacterium CRU_2_2]